MINTMGKRLQGNIKKFTLPGTAWKGFMEDGAPKQGFVDGDGGKCALCKEKMYTRAQSDGQDIPNNTFP